MAGLIIIFGGGGRGMVLVLIWKQFPKFCKIFEN